MTGTTRAEACVRRNRERPTFTPDWIWGDGDWEDENETEQNEVIIKQTRSLFIYFLQSRIIYSRRSPSIYYRF